ncbi:MAG: hypothetical protein IH984_07010 [Planctomycetes bacterium]|nr:hypothetical protein [Planctomycetota bacterium]
MSLQFKLRTYDTPITVYDVGKPPASLSIELGDEVVLYLKDDPDDKNPIHVHVTGLAGNGKLSGKISRANRPGAQGESRLTKDALLDFNERNVFGYVRRPS